MCTPATTDDRGPSRVALAAALVGLVSCLVVSSSAPAATPALGAAFTVNTVTRGSQAFPSAAINEAGAAVIVWRCEDPDLSPGICARRLSSTGETLGDELRANTYTPGVQGAPDVAIDADGDFVVVWESHGQDGDQQGVYAQQFLASGARVGSERRLNTTTAGRQRRPAVAMARDGSFAVVWESQGLDGSHEAVVLRRFDAAGKALTAEQVVNTRSLGQQWVADIAMAADGRFVVAWETSAYATGGGGDVAMRRYAANGAAQGPEQLVNTVTQHDQSEAAVAIAEDGSFAIGWQSFGQDGSDHGVYVHRYRANGAPVGSERRVNLATRGIQHQPAIAIAGGGTLVVVWRDAERRRVLARFVDVSGQAVGGETLIDDTFPSMPWVGADAQGDLLFAWQDTGPDISARLGRVEQPCREGEFSLCLNRSQFEIEVSWVDQTGRPGAGHARELSPDSGHYWFFTAKNVELVLKVLDGCGLNGRFWVFIAGLTDVGVEVVVTHAATGAVRVYRNPRGRPFELIRDTDAFATCGSSAIGGDSAALEATLRASQGFLQQVELGAVDSGSSTAAVGAASCAPGPNRLCLNGGRFELGATYRTGDGKSGNAGAVSVTGDAGYFWFFDQSNAEVMVKVLDGCALNGHFWVFAAGLTDVEVELTTSEGSSSRRYRNPLGRPYELVRDTEAFDCR